MNVGRSALLLYLLAGIVHAIPTTSVPQAAVIAESMVAKEQQADHKWSDVLTEMERTAPEATKAVPHTEAVNTERMAKEQQAEHNWANLLTEMERTALATNAPTSAATATSFAEVVAGAATSIGSDDSTAYMQWLIPVLCVGLPVVIALVVVVTIQCTNDKDGLPPSFDVKRDSSHTHFLPAGDHARDHAEDTPEDTPENTPEKAILPPSFE